MFPNLYLVSSAIRLMQSNLTPSNRIKDASIRRLNKFEVEFMETWNKNTRTVIAKVLTENSANRCMKSY